ncbi:MAG TPA: electron transport complex subunit RsxE, partial [Spirochaetia bacterium]|nr:electron transport complex subunit RsxE [Spirochaetia bacterium]
GMGAATIFVLLCSNVIIALLKNVIPAKVRIPAYIVVIASFVTIVDLSMQAFAPDLSRNLGVFVPLIVVNCIILGRAEAFASKHTVGSSILDALGMGIGFTLALMLIALFREVLGSGTITIFSLPIPGLEDGVIDVPGLVVSPITVFVAPAGALLVIGLLKGFFNALPGMRARLKIFLRALTTGLKNFFRACAGVFGKHNEQSSVSDNREVS